MKKICENCKVESDDIFTECWNCGWLLPDVSALKNTVEPLIMEPQTLKVKTSKTPDYVTIGKMFKNMSFSIGLYFIVNLILELIPKIFPRGFWNENIDVINITENELNSISNNYTLLNFISSCFLWNMIYTIITKLSHIGQEFLMDNDEYDEIKGARMYQVGRIISYYSFLILLISLAIYSVFYNLKE
jgi:hypothetical protein